jgi:hypothetical protein
MGGGSGGSCRPAWRSKVQISFRNHARTLMCAKSLAITCTKLNAPPLRLTYAACRQEGLQYHAGRPLGESRNRLPQRKHLRLFFIMTERLT